LFVSHSRTAPLIFTAIVESPEGTEAAALAVDPHTLEVRAKFAGRVVEPDAPPVEDTPDLPPVMPGYELAVGVAAIVGGGVLVGWDVDQDAHTLHEFGAAHGRPIDVTHRFNLSNAAAPVLEAMGETAESLAAAAEALELTEMKPHALDRVYTALEVLEGVRERAGLGAEWAELRGDELQIAELVVQRLGDGREQYGRWDLSDQRDYLQEAVEEVVDALHYSGAALLRARREAMFRRRYRVAYLATELPVDHPSVTSAIRKLLEHGTLAFHGNAFARQLAASDMLGEEAQRFLVEAADQVVVLGAVTTPVAEEAMRLAHAAGRPVYFASTEAQA